VKIVYTLLFEAVVQSRSILGLGLPSSASGNCKWPLAVHWNCLFVSNEGAFTVSRISGRLALILDLWSVCIITPATVYFSTSVIFISAMQLKAKWSIMQRMCVCSTCCASVTPGRDAFAAFNRWTVEGASVQRSLLVNCWVAYNNNNIIVCWVTSQCQQSMWM